MYVNQVVVHFIKEEVYMSKKNCLCRNCIYGKYGLTPRPMTCLNIDEDNCSLKDCETCKCYLLRCNNFSNKTLISKENEETLKSIKKLTEEIYKQETFHFSDGKEFNLSSMYPLKQIERFPTPKEIKDFLLSSIKYQMLEKGEITTEQYRSLKGEVRRDHWKGPVHFLRKTETGKSILINTINYMSTKSVYGVGKIHVTFPGVVRSEIIDININ